MIAKIFLKINWPKSNATKQSGSLPNRRKNTLNAKTNETTNTVECHVAELHQTANPALMCRAQAEH